MVRRSWKGLAMCVAALMPFVTPAQNLFELNPGDAQGAKQELGGKPAIDLVVMKAGLAGAPLRNPNVKAYSERVELNGKVLRRTAEYAVDYGAGVIYVMRAFKAGDSLVVSYRYDADKPVQPGQQSNGFAGFKFNMVSNGALQGIFGMGMTDRQADGSVITSNLYGVNNRFSFGAGSALKGLYLVGDRQQADSRDLFGVAQNEAPADLGKSKFVLQDLQTGLAGGTISANYQEISKNFSSFSAVRDSGVDGSLVDALQKEKGLKRFGFAMKDVGVGGMKFSSGYSSVDDANGSIDWRSLGFSQGDPDKGNGFRLNWNARTVDTGFNRFKDIREGDREQLAREAGLTREGFSGLFRSAVGKLSFSQDKIEDLNGNGIYKRSLQLFDGATPEASRFSLLMGDQHAELGFNRIGSLTEGEKQTYGRELGLRRQWTALQIGWLDPKNPLKYAQNMVRTDGGDLSTTKISMGGSNWAVDHLNASIDQGFGALDSLPDPEKLGHINTIASMYAPGGEPLRPDVERQWLLRSPGLEREFTRFSWRPGKSLNFVAENLDIDGRNDGTSVQTASLTGKDFSLSYRNQQMGDGFSDLNNLLEFERQRLGTIVGLDRMDLAGNFKLGGAKMSFSKTEIDSPQGGASRQSFNISGKNVEISVNQRKVDEGFTNVGQLLDPEKDLLYSLRGFTERDIKAKMQMLPGLWVDVFWFDALNAALDQTKLIHNAALTYAPNKNTSFSILRLENKNDDPIQMLFASVLERVAFGQNFGRLGSLSYLKEKQDYDGTLTDQPDSIKEHLAYEAKINSKTMVKSEITRTAFENGTAEQVSQNTLSTQITKGAGVSVSEIGVNREGDENDETKRNYGLWIDLGKGLRFSYGYARHLAGENGTMSSGVTLGQNGDPLGDGSVGDGQFGDWSVGGGYRVNEWDNGRTQAFSKVNIGTVKPQRLLGLHDVRFNFGLDTQADYANWLRENRQINFSGKLGNNAFLYRYISQMHQSGSRAIDRVFAFETDQSPSRWLVAKLMYKVRTLPWDEQIMIRDYAIIARPAKNLELTHKLQTNPEGPQRNDVILGSVPQPLKRNEWRLDYKSGPGWTLGGQYDETITEQDNARRRKAGMNLTMFQASGSPLSLYYGLEQNDIGGVRKTMQRYSIRFDQRPGPNQMFSLFFSNESFQHFVDQTMKRNNWTMRVDYQLRF
ncbi:MAG: hypothetical protein WAO58_12915 [Fimbriimonadaceae bacterium]